MRGEYYLDLAVLHLHHGLPAPGLEQVLQVLLVHRYGAHLVPDGLVA